MTLGSDGFLNRIKDLPKDKVHAMLIPVTGLPATLAQYVDYTQVVQAEGLKFGIEHYRRRKPHCSGTLLWQYNDCWPGISWSLLDSDGVAKPSWYAVKRAYAPVMASFKALDTGEVELWVTNDTLSPLAVDAKVELSQFSGALVWSEDVLADIPANSSVQVWTGKPEGTPDRVLTVHADQFARNRHFFAAIKELELGKDCLQSSISVVDSNTLSVVLLGLGYVYCILILCSEPDVEFSDNYFDMLFGETRTITIRSRSASLDAEKLTISVLTEGWHRPSSDMGPFIFLVT